MNFMLLPYNFPLQFLSEELKQSYTTKNFTLKSGLLDLEKQYRAHMNVDPAMAAFWADVTVLLVSWGGGSGGNS
jgi:hypothetical protein